MTNLTPSMESSYQLQTDDEPTLIEEFEASPAGAQEMAGARFAVEVLALLQRAMRESHIVQQQLSEALDVTPGAVSQVLHGDGNLRVGTIGRYCRALGYQAHLFLEPVEGDRRVIASHATYDAIADEFREFARLTTVAWVDVSGHAVTPANVFRPPELAEAGPINFHSLVLQRFRDPIELQATELHTGQ
jgi:transcriptional regulator with XRE-family HTH domain